MSINDIDLGLEMMSANTIRRDRRWDQNVNDLLDARLELMS